MDFILLRLKFKIFGHIALHYYDKAEKYTKKAQEFVEKRNIILDIIREG